MMTTAKKLTSVVVATLTMAAAFAFAPAANAATPAEVVFSPSVGIADDGSYVYVPGEWSGDYTTLAIAWFSCPEAQLGAIGATADINTQLADAGCVQISTDKTLPADTFDNLTTFPVIVETADDTTSAFTGNSLIMYDKAVGPIAYNFRGAVGSSAPMTRSIGFAGKSATLGTHARTSLNALLSKIGKGTKVVVTVDAYAAKGGSKASNLALAAARARQIKSYFKKHGVAATFKLRSHVANAVGAAGRQASIKVSLAPNK